MALATIPTGYDPTPLAPKIEILDENDVIQYTYESDAINAGGNGTQDFDLELWNLHRAVNTDHGNAVIVIDDPDKDLLDLTDARRDSKILPMWKFRMYLGKDHTNVSEWFRGFILGNNPDFPNPVETKHRLFAVGEGVKTAYYKTVMRYFQKKNSDDTLDMTDDTAKISEIYKRLIQNTDHHPAVVAPLGFTVNGVRDINVKVPDFQKNFESIGAACNELASMGGAYYGIDLGDAYLRRRDGVDSGFLVTNMDYDSILKDNWDQDKVAYLHPTPRGWNNNFSDFGISLFHGLNTQKAIKDKEQTVGGASLDLSASYHSFEIIPSKDNVLKIAPFLAKVGGTITDSSLTIKLMGDDGAGKPNHNDVRLTRIIKGAQLQDELAVGKYFEILFNKFSIIPGTKIHCVLDKFADAVNYPTLGYKPLAGTYHTSADGITWTAQSDDVRFKEFAAKTTHVLCENTVASKKFPGMSRQMNVPMGNFASTDLALVRLAGIAISRGKQRRQYPSFKVSAPTTPFGLAQTFRFIDKRTGIEFSPNLIAYDLGGSAYDPQSNLGANEIELTVEEWGY